jgi:hypothetical protein
LENKVLSLTKSLLPLPEIVPTHQEIGVVLKNMAQMY